MFHPKLLNLQPLHPIIIYIINIMRKIIGLAPSGSQVTAATHYEGIGWAFTKLNADDLTTLLRDLSDPSTTRVVIRATKAPTSGQIALIETVTSLGYQIEQHPVIPVPTEEIIKAIGSDLSIAFRAPLNVAYHVAFEP